MTRHATIGMTTLVLLSMTTCTIGQQVSQRGPLADNAALVYWQAFAMLPELSDEQEAALREATGEYGPIDAELAKIVESADSALAELHRGAKYSRCVWGTDFEQGPEALLTHLSKARELSRFGWVRARMRFDKGQPSDAIDDLSATMVAARHVGSDALVISLLVQYAMEKPAIDIAARHLPKLDPKALKQLADGIQSLPESRTMVDAVQSEKTLLLEWFIRKLSGPDGKKVIFDLFENQEDSNIAALRKLSRDEILQAAIELRPAYDELSKLMALPPDETDKKVEELAARPQWQGTVKNLGGMLLPGVVAARRAEAAHQARLAMFEAAISVVRDGKDSLNRKELRDPFGDGPFGYTELEDGFELRSNLVDRDGHSVTLIVGRFPQN